PLPPPPPPLPPLFPYTTLFRSHLTHTTAGNRQQFGTPARRRFGPPCPIPSPSSTGCSTAPSTPRRRSCGSTAPRPPRSGWTANIDRKSTRLNSSHVKISYAVFC